MKRNLLYLLILVFILGSCSKQTQNLSNEPKSIKTLGTSTYLPDSNFVSFEIARLIAERLPSDNFTSKNGDVLTNTIRNIQNGFSVQFETDDLPSIYVFNYSGNGGYAIISSDFRYEPVLAFSESGKLNTGDTLPLMFYEWLGYTVESVQLIREGLYPDITMANNAYTSWYLLIDNMHLRLNDFIHPEEWTPTPYNPCDDWGNTVNESKGPLLATTWGQGVGYNDLIYAPTVGTCSQYSNGKPPTGCVATAVAQILKYWSKPHAGHDFNLMPNNTGAHETQRLMSFLGNGALLAMDYECDGSGASSDKVKPTLLNKFGYASCGSLQDYENSKRWDIRTEILANRIVYVDGYNIEKIHNWGLFKVRTYADGHAWLLDGYRMNGNACYKHFWYHMNWGWDGFGNNWVFENQWVPENISLYNFQYKRKFINNISAF